MEYTNIRSDIPLPKIRRPFSVAPRGPSNTPRMIARVKGEKKFKTGKPCIRGHIGERYTNSGECIECTVNKHKEPRYRKVTEVWRLKKLGLTIQEKELILSKQKGVCPVCFKPLENSGKLCNDHCHSTGKFRGVVHDHCNKILGLAKDCSEMLRNAAAYLEQHK